jgi:hypothetical protein
MGLDWIVNIYEKDTFKQVEKKYEELGYTGINDVRGKAIANMKNMKQPICVMDLNHLVMTAKIYHI